MVVGPSRVWTPLGRRLSRDLESPTQGSLHSTRDAMSLRFSSFKLFKLCIFKLESSQAWADFEAQASSPQFKSLL